MAVGAGLLSLVFGFVLGTTGVSYALPLVVVFGAALVLVALWPLPVRIGSEGLVLSGYGCSRFVAFTEIDAIEDNANATVLRCADGRRICLFDHRQQKLDDATIRHLRTLALRCWRGGRTVLVAQRHKEQPMAAWVESLRPVLASGEGVEASRLRLFAILEEPGVPAVVRGAAALLLRDYLAPGDRSRIFALAGSTVNDELGSTLRLACAHGTPRVDILAALERLDPTRPSPLRRWSSELGHELGTALTDILELVHAVPARSEDDAVTMRMTF